MIHYITVPKSTYQSLFSRQAQILVKEKEKKLGVKLSHFEDPERPNPCGMEC